MTTKFWYWVFGEGKHTCICLLRVWLICVLGMANSNLKLRWVLSWSQRSMCDWNFHSAGLAAAYRNKHTTFNFINIVLVFGSMTGCNNLHKFQNIKYYTFTSLKISPYCRRHQMFGMLVWTILLRYKYCWPMITSKKLTKAITSFIMPNFVSFLMSYQNTSYQFFLKLGIYIWYYSTKVIQHNFRIFSQSIMMVLGLACNQSSNINTLYLIIKYEY